MTVLKIGFDGKRALHNFRGLGNYSRGIIEGLLTYSHHQLFLYAKMSNDSRALSWINEQSKNSNLICHYPENIAKLFPSLWRTFSLDREARLKKIDIFHGLTHEIPYSFSRKRSYKAVVTIHDLLYLRFPHFFSPVDRLTYHQKFKYATTQSDLVIAICQQTKKDLIELLKVDEKKIVVHYQSCDPIFYQKLNEEIIKNILDKNQLSKNLYKNYVLNVAAFEPNKNQLSLIDAFALISKNIPHHLVLVGSRSQYNDRCRERVLELKLSQRVHFLSGVSFLDLPAIYQGASAFCFPSFFEGFGIPIVEALFSSIPVATTAGGCFPESAGPSSLYFDPHSSASIAEVLLKILDNPELSLKMALEGELFSRQFHRKHSIFKLTELYNQLF